MTARTIIAAFAFALAASLCAHAQEGTAPPPGVSLSVGSGQSVSLAGKAESIRQVVIALCAEAGVELREYTAVDRAFAGNYEDVEMSDLIKRVLREESVAVGLRKGEDGELAISWLRVIGDAEMRPLPSAPGRPEPRKPVTALSESEQVLALLSPVFRHDSPSERRREIGALAQRLAKEQNLREALNTADPDEVANGLAEYDNARRIMAEIQNGRLRADARKRLAVIASRLAGILRMEMGR